MSNVKLSAKWQLDAALLSRPVDLTALVSLSRKNPESFLDVDEKAKEPTNTLQRLINVLLNEKNANKSDKDTKLDVLNILANVSIHNKKCLVEVRNALSCISEWFEGYLGSEEGDKEPELHKAMVLLLARCWDYKIKTEDVLELTGGDRRIALCTVVGLLEDGETYSTTLKQKQAPGQGKMGQWEHELVIQRYEKPLLLQVCRLLRGFTHPGTYFSGDEGENIALYNVEKFGDEMDTLLEITLRSRFVEKLSNALFDCMFNEDAMDDLGDSSDSKDNGKESKEDSLILEESDHLAVACVNAYLQNLYFYASENVEEFRQHLLMDTLLIPQLIIPYLERCILHVMVLNSRAQLYSQLLEGDQVSSLVLHNPQLLQGMHFSLRTLIIASFRAPNTQYIMVLLKRLNPTLQLLKATTFIKFNEYLFTLLCMLNVNMGALDLSRATQDQSAHTILSNLSDIFNSMDYDRRSRILKRVMTGGALPIARDTPSYTAVMSILLGGGAGQLEYTSRILDGKEGAGASSGSGGRDNLSATMMASEEESAIISHRLEYKKEFQDRMESYKSRQEESSSPGKDEFGGDSSGGLPREEEELDRASEPKYASQAAPRMDAKGGASGAGAGGSNNKDEMSSFAVAVAVAQASKDHQRERESSGGDAKGSGLPPIDKDGKYRLLGDLPSLVRNPRKNDKKLSVNLDLPIEAKPQLISSKAKENIANSISSSNNNNNSKASAPVAGDDIPKEFLCSINGHVMKDPVYASNGSDRFYFERETITLWLETRGSVNPKTLQPLSKQDLVTDEDLKNRIKRYHIQKTAMRVQQQSSDDVYDF